MSQNISSNMKDVNTKAGFVAVVGRPNAGKSSFLNWIVGEKLALVSHKANATRKRFNAIANHKNAQFVFIDTPGIHKVERLLNEYMLEEALKAMREADLVLFLSPIEDKLKYYEEFLEIHNHSIPHIVLLSKVDTVKNDEVLKKLLEFNKYQDKFEAIIPLSIEKGFTQKYLLESLSKYLPNHPFYYDEDILTTSYVKEIYKEFIRESVFKYIHKEIPYHTDILVTKVVDKPNILEVHATIIVEKDSFKPIVIGKNAKMIKLIGQHSRHAIQNLEDKKVFLKLDVKVDKNWTKDQKSMKSLGYEI